MDRHNQGHYEANAEQAAIIYKNDFVFYGADNFVIKSKSDAKKTATAYMKQWTSRKSFEKNTLIPLK
jgi:hypothetical protein